MTNDDRVHIEALPTGVPNLDRVLGGGLPALSLTIVAGGPGAGKTTLANQILFHLGSPDRPAIYFALLGEPLVKVLRYQQQFAFFDLARVGRDVIYVDLADVARTGTAEDVLARVTAEVERRDPAMIALDSARAVEELAGGGDVTGRRAFSHDLSLTLASWQTTSLLLGQYRAEELLGRPELSVADGLVWLERALQPAPCPRELQVVNLRGMNPLVGRHCFRIDGTGLRIYPHLPASIEVAPTAGRAAFGVPGLDAMLGGGLPAGQSCLLTGSPGAGKTTLALHFLVEGLRADEPGVLASFEEPPAQLAGLARGFGWDLDEYARQGRLRSLAPRLTDLAMDEAIFLIGEAVDAIGARRLVLNGLPGFELATTPNDTAGFLDGLARLLASLRARGVTVALTGGAGDVLGELRPNDRGLVSLTDAIILLRTTEIDAAPQRTLAVVKVRGSDHDRTLAHYAIGPAGVQVGQPAAGG